MSRPSQAPTWPPGEGIGEMIRTGRLVARETVLEGGVDAFPEALTGLFAGVNTGKLVLKVA